VVVEVFPDGSAEGAGALAVDDPDVLNAVRGNVIQQVIDAPQGFIDKAMIASD
jgi:hypothetical protein